MRIAIAGPDGAGKSSICTCLCNQMQNVMIIYAGKREFLLKSTEVGLEIWHKMRQFGLLANIFARFFIYYPLEFLESYIKFSKKESGKKHYIYDRHPIDRVVMKHELIQQYKSGKVQTVRFWVEYPLLCFFAALYVYVFPLLDQIFILLPTPELCFERSNGQYKEIDQARIKIEAYRRAVKEWKQHENYFTLIEVTSEMDVTMISDLIIKKCN